MLRQRETVKTYFVTRSLESTLPPEFVAARGKKFIVVRYCVAEVGDDGYMPYDLCLHADFIKRDDYLDHFVDVVNIIDNGSKPSKYEYPENGPKTFKIWFTMMDGTPVTVSDFILKLLLIYNA